MSKRTQIVKALSEALKVIDGSEGYNTNLFNNSFPKLKFWDEVNDFPAVYMTPGPERREYHPSNFAWCFFSIGVKIYVKSETPQEDLEGLIEDVEKVVDANRQIAYSEDAGHQTTEILIESITTDEGLLAPYGVGEIILMVRYQKMNA
jgi:hypothetical protein